MLFLSLCAGAEHGISSDGFFELESLPKYDSFAAYANSTTFTCLVSGIFLHASNRRSVIVGAGYIAIEMAGILHTLGSDSTLVIRKDKVS